VTGRRAIPILVLALAMQAGTALDPLVIPRPASAHNPPFTNVMNAFVKIEPREAQVVVRVPLPVLEPAKFPLSGRELDLPQAGPAIDRALANLGRQITIAENGRPLVPSSATGRLTLPSDRSFERYDDAVGHVARPVAPGTTLYADQAYFDAHLTYAIASPNSQLTIRTAVAPELKDYLKLAIRYLPLGEEGRAMVITSRSGTVALNPRWFQAAAGFVALGIAHILSGVDHLLFLLCLIIPGRRLREILAIVTAFTVAHSVTLLGSAYNLAPEGAWFPPFVETLIAASIVYMALENIVGADLRRRWLIAGLFGLVHGFGFAYGLRENLQLAGRHLLVSLFAFNIGIEIGQVLVLAVMLPALALLLRYVLVGRTGMIILSAIVANVGWDWMIERGEVLWRVDWPRLDAAGLASLARWVAGVLLAAGGASLLVKRLGLAHRSVSAPERRNCLIPFTTLWERLRR
jgi:HupE / UreJ protein